MLFEGRRAMKRLLFCLLLVLLAVMMISPVQAVTYYNVPVWNTNMDGTAYNASTQTFANARVASPFTWNPSGSPGSDQVKITGASASTVSLDTFGIICFNTLITKGNTTVSATLHLHTLNATSGFASHNLHQIGNGTMGVTGFDETQTQWSNANLGFDIINSTLFNGADFAVNDLDPSWVTQDNDTAIPLNAAGVAYITSSSALHPSNPMTCLATRYADFDIANNPANLTLANGQIDSYQYYDTTYANVAGQASYLTLGFPSTGTNATAISNVSTDNNKPLLPVQFNDTSTGLTETGYNWSVTDLGLIPNVTSYLGETKNITQTFGAGNFSIVLTVTDQYGLDKSPPIFLNISAGIVRKGLSQISFTGIQQYPLDSVFNTPIDNLPVDPMSSTWIANAGVAYPDPYVYVGRTLSILGVDNNITPQPVTRAYGSAPLNTTVLYPIPDYGKVQTGAGTDHAMQLLNPDSMMVYTLYSSQIMRRANGTYALGSAGAYNLNSNALSTTLYDRQDPPLVLESEMLNGSINHVMGWALPNTGTHWIWPGIQDDGTNSSALAPPIGSRWRLKASFSEAGYSHNATIFLEAWKHYGFQTTDNAGAASQFMGTEVDVNINTQFDINSSTFAGLHASDFEIVNMTPLMVASNSLQAYQPPVISFTSNVTTGNAPLVIQLNDTTTNTLITSWQWAIKNQTSAWTVLSTSQNVTVTLSAGNYNINLTESNPAYTANLIKSGYIASTPIIPFANFTCTPLSGAVPLTVQCTDTSTFGGA